MIYTMQSSVATPPPPQRCDRSCFLRHFKGCSAILVWHCESKAKNATQCSTTRVARHKWCSGVAAKKFIRHVQSVTSDAGDRVVFLRAPSVEEKLPQNEEPGEICRTKNQARFAERRTRRDLVFAAAECLVKWLWNVLGTFELHLPSRGKRDSRISPKTSRHFLQGRLPRIVSGEIFIVSIIRRMSEPRHHYFSKTYWNTPLQFVLQYASNLYRSTFGAPTLWGKGNTVSTRPSCIAVRLPFVLQYASHLYRSTLGKSWCLWSRDVPQIMQTLHIRQLVISKQWLFFRCSDHLRWTEAKLKLDRC